MSRIPEGLMAVCDYDEKNDVIVFKCKADTESLEGCFSQDAPEQIKLQCFPDTSRIRNAPGRVIIVNSESAAEISACLKRFVEGNREEILKTIQGLDDKFGRNFDEMLGTPARKQTTLDDIINKLDSVLDAIQNASSTQSVKR